jgi:hypothetical protein
MTVGEIALLIGLLVNAGAVALVSSMCRKTNSDVQKVHDLTNSRLTELLVEVRKTSRAEGLKEGRAERWGGS